MFRPPIAVDPKFRVPSSQVFHVGLEREIRSGFAAYADYFFKDIRNILGVRVTNLAFEARLPDDLARDAARHRGSTHQHVRPLVTAGTTRRLSPDFERERRGGSSSRRRIPSRTPLTIC